MYWMRLSGKKPVRPRRPAQLWAARYRTQPERAPAATWVPATRVSIVRLTGVDWQTQKAPRHAKP